MTGSRWQSKAYIASALWERGGKEAMATSDQSPENTLSLRDGSEPLSITSVVSTGQWKQRTKKWGILIHQSSPAIPAPDLTLRGNLVGVIAIFEREKRLI